MNRVYQTYDRPREKAKARGVAILSDTELLQLMIGSGTGKASVGKIARRAGRLLQRFGSSVTYQQLNAINGLGPARTSQLLAMFELASRYPVDNKRVSLKSGEDKYQQLVKEKLAPDELGYLTFDGASRLIRQRKMAYQMNTLDISVRSMCAESVTDDAAYLHVGRYVNERLLIPSLADLDAAKSLAAVGRLLGFTASYIIFNNQDWHSVTKDVSHVER
jgi:DNA repair protein RadC